MSEIESAIEAENLKMLHRMAYLVQNWDDVHMIEAAA